MIPQVLILSLVAVASASIPYDAANYDISPSVENYSARPQPYNINIDVTDKYGARQNRREEGDDLGNKRGSYGFIDAFGIARQVDYVADDRGFRAVVRTNEPGTESQNPADVEIISNAAQAPVSQDRQNIPVVSQPAPAYERATGRQSSVYEQDTGRQTSVYGQASGYGQAAGRQDSVYGQAAGRQDSVYGQAAGRQDSVYGQAAGRQDSVYGQAGGRQDSVYGQAGGRQDSVYGQAAGRQDSVYGQAAGRQDSVYGQAGGRQDSVYEQAGGRQASAYEQAGGRQASAYEQSAGRPSAVSEISPVARPSAYEQTSGRLTVTPVTGTSPAFRQSGPAHEKASGRINVVSVPVSRVSPFYRQSVPTYERTSGRINVVSVPVSGGISRIYPVYRQYVPAQERNAVPVSRESPVNRQAVPSYEHATGRFNAISAPVSGGSSIVRQPVRQVHSASATVRAPSSSSLSSPHTVSFNRAGHY